jgi:hypothetical protein
MCTPVFAVTHYVDLNSTNPNPPYGSWETAATNIQAAVDQSASSDTVLVKDGHYMGGIDLGTNIINLISANGPTATIIDAAGRTNCIVSSNTSMPGCLISGFTITGGYANIPLKVQLEHSSDMQTWTNSGEAVEWIVPACGSNGFYRTKLLMD